MKLKYRRTKVGLIVVVLVVVLTVLTVVGAQAGGPAVQSREDVVKFGFEGLYPPEEDGETVGHSNLVRQDDRVIMQVNTSELIPGGVYTYWLLADEPEVSGPAPWDLIIWADYVIVGSNGKDATNLQLATGAAGLVDRPDAFVDFGDPGLNDPYGAAIEIEIVYHGQVEDLPEDPELAKLWFTTFWVGDPEVCTIELGIPVDPICPLAQLTFHEQ